MMFGMKSITLALTKEEVARWDEIEKGKERDLDI